MRLVGQMVGGPLGDAKSSGRNVIRTRDFNRVKVPPTSCRSVERTTSRAIEAQAVTPHHAVPRPSGGSSGGLHGPNGGCSRAVRAGGLR